MLANTVPRMDNALDSGMNSKRSIFMNGSEEVRCIGWVVKYTLENPYTATAYTYTLPITL